MIEYFQSRVSLNSITRKIYFEFKLLPKTCQNTSDRGNIINKSKVIEPQENCNYISIARPEMQLITITTQVW